MEEEIKKYFYERMKDFEILLRQYCHAEGCDNIFKLPSLCKCELYHKEGLDITLAWTVARKLATVNIDNKTTKEVTDEVSRLIEMLYPYHQLLWTNGRHSSLDGIIMGIIKFLENF